MSSQLIGFIGIIVLLIVVFSRVPIGPGMALVGFVGFASLKGIPPALGLIKQVPFELFSQYSMMVVPLFVLMGAFCWTAGLSEDLYRFVNKWMGYFRGGLAMATVGACGFFAAISGSSVATSATMAKVALPEMRKYKYDPGLATGCIAAGGSIGILIPPSIVLIIYGIIAEQSIGKLFLAGFFPGILEAVFYIVTIAILVKIKPQLGPRGVKASLKEKTVALFKVWEVLVLFVCVIGGIYAGVFTPTEAAGVGAFGAFFFTLIKGRLNWDNFKSSLVDTTKTTGMIFVIIMGAMIFGYFLAVTRLPFELGTMIAELSVNRYVILVLIFLVLMLLGCVMDAIAIILLTVPIFFPLIVKLNFDPIWFGILIVRVTEMGLITPPVGINIYIIKGISNVPMGTIFRGVIPFIIADVLHIALLLLFPQISLFLPGMMD